MPHLRIEVSTELATALDWNQLADNIHSDLADCGWAAINDLKTRVFVCAAALAGKDRHAQQLVATLIITNPRPAEVQHAMTDRILDRLEKAVRDLQPVYWVQCCVFLQVTPKQDYAKRQWNAPTALQP